jgi:transcriptional regulator with XRE-family HTH domain
MTQTNDTPRTIHQGRNIKRFREMLGIKQEALASTLGYDWNQKKISLLEQKEIIEPALLQQVSSALKIPVEAFENFDEEQAVNIIANTFHADNSSVGLSLTTTINPMEKWLEAIEENKKLYERLLQAEKEKVQLLQEILNNTKK